MLNETLLGQERTATRHIFLPLALSSYPLAYAPALSRFLPPVQAKTSNYKQPASSTLFTKPQHCCLLSPIHPFSLIRWLKTNTLPTGTQIATPWGWWVLALFLDYFPGGKLTNNWTSLPSVMAGAPANHIKHWPWGYDKNPTSTASPQK